MRIFPICWQVSKILSLPKSVFAHEVKNAVFQLMAMPQIDASLLAVFLTTTGYVALESNQLNADDEQELFGNGGVHPPRPLRDLISDMLETTKISPDTTDTDDLCTLKSDLEDSLVRVQETLSLLNSLKG